MSDNDFGFTTYTVEDAKTFILGSDTEKAQKMYDLIMPFLNNLKKDSETSPVIHWPNRAKAIDDFIAKLNKIKG